MIRLYGTTIKNSSWTRVTNGIIDSLGSLNLLENFFDIDNLHDIDDGMPVGHDAEVGVFIGEPTKANVMLVRGSHKHRLVMVAANSTWLPKGMMQFLDRVATAYLAPTYWAASIIQKYTNLPVYVWKHGISDLFFYSKEEDNAKIEEFSILHLTSTEKQRKGTRELIEAFVGLVLEEELPITSKLTLVTDGYYETYKDFMAKLPGCQEVIDSGKIQILGRIDKSIEQMRQFYNSFNVICQPSRGEGFGLVPLEARACGVPVCVTSCTGHSEHIMDYDEGLVIVNTGDLSPIDDGPDSFCPSLLVDDLRLSLRCCYKNWVELKKFAVLESAKILSNWNWSKVTREFLENFKNNKSILQL